MATMCFERAGDSYWERKSKASSLRANANRLRDLNPEDSNAMLREAAEIFEGIGMAESAAQCFSDLGDYKRAGRLNDMRDVIEQMKEDSCECKDSVFVSTIKTYANVGLHIGAKTEYDFGRVRVNGERSLGNNRRARFNALYQVPEYCDIDKIKGKFDVKTVIITIPTIPGKVPKKETQPTEQEPPKEPSQEAKSNPEEEKEGTPPSHDNQESKEEAGHATSTSNPPNI
ncbi:hypothetical protein JHK84_050454 [Glycine max]|nr:hypothetical protein JHK84_050454 [Glycine max]